MTDNGEGRVTTREFYKALLEQNERMDVMERRILDKIDCMVPHEELKRVEGRIDRHEDRLDEGDKANKIIAAIGLVITGLLAIFVGTK